MTTRDQIKRYLGRWPNKTAWQISQAIGVSAGLVSRTLNEDMKKRRVKVARSKGPRGGRAFAGYRKA
jgi:predicted ArsR family transcriptional regulator